MPNRSATPTWRLRKELNPVRKVLEARMHHHNPKSLKNRWHRPLLQMPTSPSPCDAPCLRAFWSRVFHLMQSTFFERLD